MQRRGMPIRAALFAFGAALLTLGVPAASFGQPAGAPPPAQLVPQAPPLAPGTARVWILRQFEPAESLQTPMIHVNGTPIIPSQPGTIFYRDFAPGTYKFTVDTCTIDTDQSTTLSLAPGNQVPLEVQSLRDFSSNCLTPENFYIRPITPAWVAMYLPHLSYLGAR
jgi:hypothetical protein